MIQGSNVDSHSSMEILVGLQPSDVDSPNGNMIAGGDIVASGKATFSQWGQEIAAKVHVGDIRPTHKSLWNILTGNQQ